MQAAILDLFFLLGQVIVSCTLTFRYYQNQNNTNNDFLQLQYENVILFYKFYVLYESILVTSRK